jgi:2-hydroxy-3-keto-5-methylthiopentenyl-1-phosphate phosphatase
MYVINWELTFSSWALAIAIGSFCYTWYATKMSNRHTTYNIKKSIRSTTLFIVKSFEDNLSLSIVADSEEVYKFLDNRHYLKKLLREQLEDIQKHAISYIRNQNGLEHYQDRVLETINHLEDVDSLIDNSNAQGFDDHRESLMKSLTVYNRSVNNFQKRSEDIEEWFKSNTSSSELNDKFEKVLDLSNF